LAAAFGRRYCGKAHVYTACFSFSSPEHFAMILLESSAVVELVRQMILTAQQITEAYRRGEIVIEPFREEQVQGATYDLRVGDQGITTSSKKVVNIRETGFLTLQPGDFAVVMAEEILRLGPQYVGRFGLRSKYARKGLIATTGPQIDPGYHGRLIIGLTNLAPKSITVSHGDDLLSVEFHRLDEPTTKPYNGPYQDKLALGPEEIEAIAESESMSLPEMITTLRVLTQNVGTLAREIKVVEWAIGVGFGVVAILVTVFGIAIAFKR
jgi:dCTP deaminase